MAEPQQGTMTVSSKEKKSLLAMVNNGNRSDFALKPDEVMGKGFLSSWNSMSVKEDDTMDFSFDSIPKTNNKKFNFENMDMEFNLDGNFDKLTSFSVDITDLDFSFPLKKKSNPKDKMEESSCRNQGKKENFSFSFDFNELDSFNFDSSLMEEKASEKITARNGVPSGDNEGQGFKSNEVKGNGALEDGVTAQRQPSHSIVTTEVDKLSDHQENIDVISKSSPSISATSVNSVLSCGAKKNQEKIATSAGLIKPGHHVLETDSFKEMEGRQPMVNMPEESADTDASSKGTAAAVESEHFHPNTKAITSRNGDEGTHNKVITCVESGNRNLLVKNLAALPARSLSKSISSSGRGQGDIDLCDTSTSNSRKKMHYVTAKKENQNLTKVISGAPICSQLIVDEVTLMKGKGEGSIRSRFFKRLEEAKTRLHPESAAETRVDLASNGTTDTVDIIPTDKKREILNADNTQTISEVLAESTVISRGVKECNSIMLAKMNIGNLRNDGIGFRVDDAQDGRKFSGNNGQNGRQVTETEVAAKINVNNIKDSALSGSQLNTPRSTEKAKTSSTQSNLGCSYPSLVQIQRSKIISSGKNHHCPLRPANQLTDLSNITISRNIKANKLPAQNTPDDENNSLSNLENEGNRKSNTSSTVGNTTEITIASPSLKRKSSEELDADIMLLNPPKRLSESPNQSRNTKDTAGRFTGEQNKEKNAFWGHGTSRTEFSPELQTTGIGSPSVTDNDGNVERAEAYTKELEDICNMLRKKHEEAKELMVRAIVNNNNLLMLNHPMYEEKIHTVQQFATELMTKELPI